MSEPATAAIATARTAGGILREARQAQGLHIAALAATIKVAQRKLEALEADRLDELPDATFTRALAQTVCRALKIDATPVLALLPAPAGHRLEHVSEGINEPFREGRGEPANWMSVLGSPTLWAVLVIAVLTAAVYLMPQAWLTRVHPSSGAASAPEPAASATVSVSLPAAGVTEPASASPAASAAPVVEQAALPVPAAPAPQPAPTATVAAPAPVAAASASPTTAALQLRTVGQSWIEVQDARQQVLLSRVVEPGEAIALDGTTPLRVKIGNARATELVFRGRPLDLTPSTRDNVARLELK
ncbi:helix-turn-helix domain-containing protein [Piscinibacter sp. XHJ-5]|uniref:helix-turn-helix domain-containing protein n=1 Tax=Piscinibacter sp. XHJ-5 TaxID=3037797 RepID=UPI002452FEA7|nr:helix-turn-helix domain-containing protein [Piscinibacter sp. XHJ-5]